MTRNVLGVVLRVGECSLSFTIAVTWGMCSVSVCKLSLVCCTVWVCVGRYWIYMIMCVSVADFLNLE